MFAGMNYGILLGAALVRFGFAFLWYGFAVPKQWKAAMKESKRDIKKIDKQKSMFASFGVSLVMSYVLYNLIGYMDLYTFRDGAMFAGFLWFGFLGTLEFESIFYEGKSQRLFTINTVYQLISVALMGGVLAMWR
jgi:hypothetical protein